MGGFFAKPIFNAMTPMEPGARFETVYAEEIRPDLEKQAIFARVFRDFPDKETDLKAQLKAAFERGGIRQAREAMASAGTSIGAAVAAAYLPRARDESLVEFSKIMAETLGTMNEKDPVTCVHYQHGGKYGKPILPDQLETLLGRALVDRQTQMINTLISTAHDAPPAFDRIRGQQLLTQISDRHSPILTAKSSDVASGARAPTTPDEARAACSFAVKVFGDLAGMPATDSAAALRAIYVPATPAPG
jgi:hypothetical protein